MSFWGVDRRWKLGKIKVASGNATITGTGSINTGLSTILNAVVCVANASTTIPTDVASITSISGGTINVVVVALQSAANAIETAAKTVNWIAFGY
ncbi:MAG: hypothetical protein JTT12_05555 [Candidatus Brockarchaeota archaeon]|nr:hypothetical protein [Candidatus Brockarchaeota archaeon]